MARHLTICHFTWQSQFYQKLQCEMTAEIRGLIQDLQKPSLSCWTSLQLQYCYKNHLKPLFGQEIKSHQLWNLLTNWAFRWGVMKFFRSFHFLLCNFTAKECYLRASEISREAFVYISLCVKDSICVELQKTREEVSKYLCQGVTRTKIMNRRPEHGA